MLTSSLKECGQICPEQKGVRLAEGNPRSLQRALDPRSLADAPVVISDKLNTLNTSRDMFNVLSLSLVTTAPAVNDEAPQNVQERFRS